MADGYDTLDVIMDMDVTNNPGNSVQIKEEFITKVYANDKTKTMGLSPFMFPPGHRQRI